MADAPLWRRYARFWGADALRDVEDELAFHIEMKRVELSSAGLSEAEVEAEIERAFGDRRRIEAELKEIGMKRMQRARRAGLLDEVQVDLRHAWRAFRRRPGVPVVIVLMLALTIGAGTAVFSLLNAVVLNPIAVARPAELIVLDPENSGMHFSYPMSRLLRERSTTTEGIAGFTHTASVALRAGDHAEQLSAGLVTGNYFTVLGLRPQHGRLFVDGDEGAPNTTPYAVLSDAIWRRVFGGDPSAVGQTVALNEQPFTVVGIAPPRFRGTSLAQPVDVWVPVTMLGTVARSGLNARPDILTTWFYSIFEHVARVSPDVPVERVLAELTAIHNPALQAAEDEPGPDGEQVSGAILARPLTEAAALRSREDLLRFLYVLAAAVLIALTIACVNVANLMLMRARERQRELSIRAAVGASGGRMARQLLVECSVLALLAGALGTGVAVLSMRLLTSFSLPGGIALADVPMPLDTRMLAFTLAVSLLCALTFGLAPALTGARTDVMDILRGGSDPAAGRRWHGGNLMVAVQVALSLVLLVAGSLLLRSLQQALNVDLGFRTEGVATVAVGLRQHGYTPEQAAAFVDAVVERAERSPGVQQAAAGTRVPIETPMQLIILRQDGVPSTRPRVGLVGITPGYLDVLDLRVIRGRGIEATDTRDAPQVAVVTEAAANAVWPGEDPMGKEFVAMFGQPFTVVGVVQDAHYASLNSRTAQIFLSFAQTTNLSGMDLLRFVGAGADATTVLTSLRSAVRETDPRLPTFQERNVKQQIDAVLMPQRFGALLLGAFGVIALLISAVGIYAVAAYDVARRYRELGIRAALGARRRDLVDTVLYRAGVAICAGVVAGLAVAALTTWTLRGFLFGITPYEPLSYLAAVLLLGGVAVLASWVPARRAARVDPLEVMKG